MDVGEATRHSSFGNFDLTSMVYKSIDHGKLLSICKYEKYWSEKEKSLPVCVARNVIIIYTVSLNEWCSFPENV